jgi:uncharacterized protein (TIGR02266 family)
MTSSPRERDRSRPRILQRVSGMKQKHHNARDENTRPPKQTEELVETILEAVAPSLFDTRPSEASRPSASVDDADVLDAEPTRADHRAYPRVELDVQIDFASESHFFAGLSGDVSEGGVFVQTYRELPIGSAVDLEFVIPGGQVKTHGTVRWQRAKTDASSPGVGIAFEELPEESRTLIQSFCRARAPLYYDVEHA